jgi:hypothetical protein
LGARLAAYSIILFIDSDCESSPVLLEEHLAPYEKHEKIAAVLGRTVFKGTESFIWKVLQFTPFLKPLNLNWLILPVIFVLVNFISRIIQHFIYPPYKLSSIVLVIFSEILFLIGETGLTYESIKNF